MEKIGIYLNHIKEKKWLIKNLIPEKEIVILYAPTNHYKTFLSLKIALEVVTGSQELGATKIGKVFIYSVEPTPEDLIPRIRGLVRMSYPEYHQRIFANLSLDFDNLDLTSAGRGTVKDTKPDPDGYSYQTIKYERVKRWDEFKQISTDVDADHILMEELKDIEELSERQQKQIDEIDNHVPRHGLIIIDTLSASMGSSSINEDGAMRNVIKNLKQIIESEGEDFNKVSILVIAHTFQNVSKGIMGSSVQKNDFPTVLKIKKKKNGEMELFREKMKSVAEGTSIPFKMREVLWDEEDMIYVDIGSSMDEIQSTILDYYKSGLDKDNIRDNTFKLYEQQYINKNSFNVVFARKWKSLINNGFISLEEQGNNN